MRELHQERLFVPTGDGWSLEIFRVWVPAALSLHKRPLVLFPGFGTNAGMFAYPTLERSMAGFFATQGRETWFVNLRAQGGSLRKGGRRSFDLADLALTDVGRILDFVASHTFTSHEQVDAIGASLGGTVLYIHTAMRARHRVASMTTIGSPLRWVVRHPLLAAVLKRPGWVGWVPVRGSRLFLRSAFPMLRHIPFGIQAYIHPKTLADPSIERLVKTVDNPNRFLTKHLARWLMERDLIVNGVNITHLMHRSRVPLLCAISNKDKIVPAPVALSVLDATGTKHKEVLHIGDDETPFAHADPFIHKDAQTKVFAPIHRWLEQLKM